MTMQGLQRKGTGVNIQPPRRHSDRSSGSNIEVIQTPTVAWHPARTKLLHLLESTTGDVVMAVIMFINLVLAVLTVDTEAAGEGVPVWMIVFTKALVFFYLVECCVRLYVYRWSFFDHCLNVFDLIIVIADLVALVLDAFLSDVVTVDFTAFRIIRVIRLVRSTKIMVLFNSLYLLVNGVVGAFQAVLWAFVMISLALVLCSIFAVAVIQPYVDELAATGALDGCDRCALAYSSVWYAYTTFFQQVVAGDSWGLVTLPVMDAHPWTAFFFIPSLLCIQLGLINMMLAVIVDSAEEAREANMAYRLQEKDKEMREANKELQAICRSMDSDDSGELTLEEILTGYDNNHAFNKILRLMDVSKDDMRCVFNILDSDRSGSCTYAEFVDSLRKMKMQDSHTLLVFIKSYVTDVKHSLEASIVLLKESMGILKDDITHKLTDIHEAAGLEDDRRAISKQKSNAMSQASNATPMTAACLYKPVSTEATEVQCATTAADCTTAATASTEDLLRIMSENIERKLDELSQQLAAPLRQVAGPSPPMQQRLGPPLMWPQTICCSAEKHTVFPKEPSRTPSTNPPCAKLDGEHAADAQCRDGPKPPARSAGS